MSFDQYETHPWDGEPCEVVDIIYGSSPSDIVCVTSADYSFELEGNTYTPAYLDRDPVTGDGNPYDSEQNTIKLARGNPFETIYLEQDFLTTVMVRIRELHLNDGAQETRVIWNGRLTGVSWERTTMNIGTERLGTYMKHSGLSMKYQVGQCVNVLYHGLCRLNKEDWREAGTINTVTGGVQLDITEAATGEDGRFVGGILTVNGINRYILQHSGSTIVVERGAHALLPSAIVDLYPGCPRLRSICTGRFNNEINYLAFDHMPNYGMFDGGSLN